MSPRLALRIPAEARRLCDSVIDECQARGVPVQEHELRIELGLPVLRLQIGDRVLRGCWIRFPGPARSRDPDVVTVHGSGHRATKMWPRRRDGAFDLAAVANHILALVQQELDRPRPTLTIQPGVTAAESGLHVVHLAAVWLGAADVPANPNDLLDRLAGPEIRDRIDKHRQSGGLTDRDMRPLGDAAGLFLSTPSKLDSDPLAPINDRILTVLQIGNKTKSGGIERRYVLLLDRTDGTIDVADPAGDGLTAITASRLSSAWKLAATRGRTWIGTVSVARSRDENGYAVAAIPACASMQ